jgi:uncharacterized protein (DUF4415 family)
MAKIKYEKNDHLTEEDLDPKNVKERISIWVPEEVVSAFRNRAEKEDSKYQTLMNEALREYLKRPSLVDRIQRIEEKLGIKKAS